MLQRFVTQEDSFPFSDINPSIIGQKVILRNKLSDSVDFATIIVVDTYEVVKGTDADAPLFYYFNGDDDIMFRADDRFIVWEAPEAGFGNFYFDYRYSLGAIKVGNAGVDLLGNNATFPSYKDRNGLVQKSPITGKVITVSKKDGEYSITLGSENMKAKVVIRLTGDDQVIV